MVCMILNDNDTNNFLYVVDTFYDSRKISNSEYLKKIFSKVIWFRTKKNAIYAASKQRPDIVFIDGDVGVQHLLQLLGLKIRSVRTEVNVYEEGIGTYRTDLTNNKIKRSLFSLFGVGFYFGGCFFTKKIHVFESDIYIQKIPSLKHKVRKINVEFQQWISENKNILINIFSPNFKINKNNRTAHLYLSDWNIDWNFINYMEESGDFFVKFHPHIKTVIPIKQEKQFILIPRALPAEIAIMSILEKYDNLIVYHRNSTCMHYVTSKNMVSAGIDNQTYNSLAVNT